MKQKLWLSLSRSRALSSLEPHAWPPFGAKLPLAVLQQIMAVALCWQEQFNQTEQILCWVVCMWEVPDTRDKIQCTVAYLRWWHINYSGSHYCASDQAGSTSSCHVGQLQHEPDKAVQQKGLEYCSFLQDAPSTLRHYTGKFAIWEGGKSKLVSRATLRHLSSCNVFAAYEARADYCGLPGWVIVLPCVPLLHCSLQWSLVCE